MTKIMISQPMNGRTDDEILAVRDRIAAELTKKNGYEVVDTFINETPHFDGNVNLSVYYLGATLCKMSECDAVYFASGWEYA